MSLLSGLIPIICSVCGGAVMAETARHFLPESRYRILRIVPCFLFAVVLGLPTWVGDENTLYVYPAILAIFLLCYSGAVIARFVVGNIFFTILLPINMIIGTMRRLINPGISSYDANLAVALVLWIAMLLIVRRISPGKGELQISLRFWLLVGLLALAPLFATISFSIWAESESVRELDLVTTKIGLTIMPFVLLSSVALLTVIVLLARFLDLEKESQLSAVQAVYYQGLQREQADVRSIRHDLRNHVLVMRNLLEQNKTGEAVGYLDALVQSPALSGAARICENETANAVLSNKAILTAQEGGVVDCDVNLPANLPISDVDLCVLLGNAGMGQNNIHSLPGR